MKYSQGIHRSIRLSAGAGRGHLAGTGRPAGTALPAPCTLLRDSWKALTGIRERRWWEPGIPLSKGAIAAAQEGNGHRRNLAASDIGALIYAGVCREQFEPATACRVAAS